MSAVRKLYDQYARPLARVVYGLPLSWEPILATFPLQDWGGVAAWSPCNRFIAVTSCRSTRIGILDAVTLKGLNTLDLPQSHQIGPRWLSFSPDGRLLSQFSGGELINWDFQTGGPICTIPKADGFTHWGCSSAYSIDGEMIAVASRVSGQVVFGSPFDVTVTILTYNLLSGTHVDSYTATKDRLIPQIWTHGECIRFASVEPGFITIWEAKFGSVNTPRMVNSYPNLPDGSHSSENFLFLPARSRLAFTTQRKGSIWDAQDSKFLLDFTSRVEWWGMSFSSDGCFFACAADRELCVWKESPVGYVLHQTLVFNNTTGSPMPLFSPNGESITMLHDLSVSLWPTGDPIDPPDQSVVWKDFHPVFSPDETLAAAVRPKENGIIILDLESGDPRLIIDMDMEVSSLRVTGSMVVVAGREKVVRWDIPARNSPPNVRANVSDSVHSITFDRPIPRSPVPLPVGPSYFLHASISPDLRYIATTERAPQRLGYLHIYDMQTGKYLTSTSADPTPTPHFTPDGRQIWCENTPGSVAGWTITEESESCLTKLEPLEPSMCPLGVFFSESSCGYEVMRNGWVLSPAKKRLLWLPHSWLPYPGKKVWKGRFYGFFYGAPPELVILEFLERPADSNFI